MPSGTPERSASRRSRSPFATDRASRWSACRTETRCGGAGGGGARRAPPAAGGGGGGGRRGGAAGGGGEGKKMGGRDHRPRGRGLRASPPRQKDGAAGTAPDPTEHIRIVLRGLSGK